MSTPRSDSSEPRPIVYFALQNGGRRPTTFTPDHRDRLTGLVSASLAACPDSRVHAFSWTSSEIRIALEAGSEALRHFVREMSSRHREHIHSEICGAECLFDRGYGGTAVTGERELLHVVEHIHNAPVRAGLAAHPSEYRWSSCRAYLGLERVSWLTTEVVKGIIGSAQRSPEPSYARRRGINEQAEAYRSPV